MAILEMPGEPIERLHPPLRIFISSTTEDLENERDALEQAIRELELFEPVRSETIGSQSATPREICALMAQRCDIYIGILGRRYGYVLPEEISATEFEFNIAQQTGKPTLIYRKKIPDVEPKQQEFIDRICDFDKGMYISEFTDNDVPCRLTERVKEDLSQHISRIVRGEVPAVTPPTERDTGITPSGERTLIASLGRSPGAVTGLYYALKDLGKPVDRVFTISTIDFTVKRAVREVHRALQEEDVVYEDTPISALDIANDRDAQEFKGAVYNYLVQARDDGDEICLGIAGGRAVMGSLLTLVAQMEAPEGTLLYQLSVPDDIWEDGQIPRFLRLPPERKQEVLRSREYHLVKVPFARFEFGET